jgi:hypothetical protein
MLCCIVGIGFAAVAATRTSGRVAIRAALATLSLLLFGLGIAHLLDVAGHMD